MAIYGLLRRLTPSRKDKVATPKVIAKSAETAQQSNRFLRHLCVARGLDSRLRGNDRVKTSLRGAEGDEAISCCFLDCFVATTVAPRNDREVI